MNPDPEKRLPVNPAACHEPDGIGRMLWTLANGRTGPGWLTREQLEKILRCPGRIKLYRITDRDGVSRLRGWYRQPDDTRKSIRLGELDATAEQNLRCLVEHHNRVVPEPRKPVPASRLYSQLLEQRNQAWRELKSIAQRMGYTFSGCRFGRAYKEPELVCEPDWYWETLPPEEASGKSRPRNPEERLLRDALVCRSKAAHSHQADPKFAFDLLSILIRQLNDHLATMIRRRFLEDHRYHAAMLLRYLGLHETVRLIEERDYRTRMEFRTLRKTIRMNVGVDRARNRLGLEKMPEIPVQSWNEFVGRHLGEIIRLARLANGEPDADTTDEILEAAPENPARDKRIA